MAPGASRGSGGTASTGPIPTDHRGAHFAAFLHRPASTQAGYGQPAARLRVCSATARSSLPSRRFPHQVRGGPASAPGRWRSGPLNARSATTTHRRQNPDREHPDHDCAATTGGPRRPATAARIRQRDADATLAHESPKPDQPGEGQCQQDRCSRDREGAGGSPGEALERVRRNEGSGAEVGPEIDEENEVRPWTISDSPLCEVTATQWSGKGTPSDQKERIAHVAPRRRRPGVDLDPVLSIPWGAHLVHDGQPRVPGTRLAVCPRFDVAAAEIARPERSSPKTPAVPRPCDRVHTIRLSERFLQAPFETGSARPRHGLLMNSRTPAPNNNDPDRRPRQ